MDQLNEHARCFRVEHRTEADTPARLLGYLAGVAAHHQSLVLYVARLRREVAGATGTVALVDDATGATVARRYLDRTQTSRAS
jgi:hypothetical protein